MSTNSSYVYNLKKEYYEKSIKELGDKIYSIINQIEEIEEEIYVLEKYNDEFNNKFNEKIDNLTNIRDDLKELLVFYSDIRNELEESFEEFCEE